MTRPEPEPAMAGGHDGPVAEFAALREEIQERFRAHHHLLSLQLTLSGAVFGFVISQRNMTALLLILPFSSYLLCGRLVAQHFAILRVARYIDTQISHRVPGGLGWERWLGTRRGHPHLLGSTLPQVLTFAGPGTLALMWTGYAFVREDVAVVPAVGMVLLWSLGWAATLMSVVLVLQQAGRLRAGGWERANLS